MLDADVVISIGKTVPYCLASRTPVFIYDHFAGPGYLNAENLERAAWYNFSGRCSRTPRSAEQLATELVEGYSEGVAFMRELPEAQRGAYRLRPQLMKLLERIEHTLPNGERLEALEAHRQAMRHEKALAEAAGMFYRMWRGAHLTVQRLRAQQQ